MEGVVFTDGRVALQWMSEPRSFVMWDRFEDLWAINIASHPSNETVVVFDGGLRLAQADKPDVGLFADLFL